MTIPLERCMVEGIPMRCLMSVDPNVACRAAAEVRLLLLLLLLLGRLLSLLLLLARLMRGLAVVSFALAGTPLARP